MLEVEDGSPLGLALQADYHDFLHNLATPPIDVYRRPDRPNYTWLVFADIATLKECLAILEAM